MELKIVIQIKDNRALVGVQKPDVDPFLKQVELAGVDDAAILHSLGEGLAPLVMEAEEHWAATPRYAAYTPPKPEPTAQPTAAEAKPRGKRLPAEKAAKPAEPELSQAALPFF